MGMPVKSASPLTFLGQFFLNFAAILLKVGKCVCGWTLLPNIFVTFQFLSLVNLRCNEW